MTVPSPIAPDSPAFDPARAAVFAIGIGAPVAACLLVAGPAVALFAGVGANALFIDTRRGIAAWPLVALATLAAALLPWGMARGVFSGTLAATVFCCSCSTSG
jgi:hypothetical protein